ncbi:MAG TPA: hypothetical protein VJK54_05495 [Chthoniobacterales bacterium]|nr:hypothetical protein [Chthoniobacterales bacterium]
MSEKEFLEIVRLMKQSRNSVIRVINFSTNVTSFLQNEMTLVKSL